MFYIVNKIMLYCFHKKVNLISNLILIANIIAFLSSLVLILTGLIKDKKRILIGSTIQKILDCISNVMLEGYSGAISNITGIIRNYLCYKSKLNIVSKIILTIIQVLLYLIFDDFNIITLLPFLATTLYTFLMVYDAKKLKILSITTTILWVIYNFYIQSYASFMFNVLSIITNLIGLFKLSKANKNDKNTQKNST